MGREEAKRALDISIKANKIISKAGKYHGNIKCDCGHRQKDHYNGEGWCHDSKHPKAGQCGCTWFYPNIYYIRRKKITARAIRKKSSTPKRKIK